MKLSNEKDLELGTIASTFPNTVLARAAFIIYEDAYRNPFKTCLKMIPVIVSEIYYGAN